LSWLKNLQTELLFIANIKFDKTSQYMPLLHGTMVKNATLSIFGAFLIFSGNRVTQQLCVSRRNYTVNVYFM
jgi:hypothetical protein